MPLKLFLVWHEIDELLLSTLFFNENYKRTKTYCKKDEKGQKYTIECEKENF